MKNVIICALLIVGFSYSASSQDCGDINIWQQSQIDNFSTNYPECFNLDGNLNIESGQAQDITNLNGLSQLNEVTGRITVRGNEMLTSLSGLDNITYIGGNLVIQSNPVLKSLSAFNDMSLTSIGGYIIISGNPEMTNLDGLSNVSHIYGDEWGDGLDIFVNKKLRNIDELSNLQYIGGNISIWGNEELVSISSLNNLLVAQGKLEIGANPKLNNLSGLNNITTVGGSLIITGAGMTNLDELENIQSIGGALVINSNDFLFDINGIDNIDPNSISDSEWGVYKNLEIYDNQVLSECAIKCICEILDRTDITTKISLNNNGCLNVDEINEACLSVSVESPAIAKLQIYPNPVNEVLYIKSEKFYELDMVGILGIVHKSLKLSSGVNEINMSELPNGAYYLRTETGEIFKVIKQ